MSTTGVTPGSGRWVRFGLFVLADVPVAAGTQVSTRGFAEGSVGDGQLSSGLALGADWVINLTLVEYILGRRKVTPSRPTSAMVGS
jgi:hypothetical protein